MSLRGGWRSVFVLVLVPLVGASTSSCGGCDKKSCMLPGVYASIDTIVTADECNCVSLSYEWRDGGFHRQT